MKCHLVSFGGGEIFASKRDIIRGCANEKVKRSVTLRSIVLEFDSIPFPQVTCILTLVMLRQ